MFGKLLKHELKATAPLMLLVNGIAFLSSISLWLPWVLLIRIPIEEITPIVEITPNIVSDLVGMIIILYLGILVFGSLATVLFLSSINPILLFPFYKRRFTRRGYLTFSLPVEASQDFIAALTVILFWNVVAFLMLFLVFALVSVSIGMGPSESWPYYTNLFVLTPSKKLDADDWFAILSVVSVFLYRTVAGMTAVVIAGNYLRRAKAVGTVALYAALRLPVMAFMFLTDLGRSVQYAPVADILASFGYEYLFSGITNDLYPFYSIILLALTITGCILSIHIIKKRLNLE